MKYKITYAIMGMAMCLTACGSSSNKKAENLDVMNYIETNTDSEETSTTEESTTESSDESVEFNMDSLEVLAESARDALASISENRYQDGGAEDDIDEDTWIRDENGEKLVITEDGIIPESQLSSLYPTPSTSQPKPLTQTPAQTGQTDTWVDPITGKTFTSTPNDPSKNRDDITADVEAGPEFQGTFIQ